MGDPISETRMLRRCEMVNCRDFVVLDLPVQDMERDLLPTHMKVCLQSDEKEAGNFIWTQIQSPVRPLQTLTNK